MKNLKDATTSIVLKKKDVDRIVGNRSKFIRDAIDEKLLLLNPNKEQLEVLRIESSRLELELKELKDELEKDIKLNKLRVKTAKLRLKHVIKHGNVRFEEVQAKINHINKRFADAENLYLKQNKVLKSYQG